MGSSSYEALLTERVNSIPNINIDYINTSSGTIEQTQNMLLAKEKIFYDAFGVTDINTFREKILTITESLRANESAVNSISQELLSKYNFSDKENDDALYNAAMTKILTRELKGLESEVYQSFLENGSELWENELLSVLIKNLQSRKDVAKDNTMYMTKVGFSSASKQRIDPTKNVKNSIPVILSWVAWNKAIDGTIKDFFKREKDIISVEVSKKNWSKEVNGVTTPIAKSIIDYVEQHEKDILSEVEKEFYRKEKKPLPPEKEELSKEINKMISERTGVPVQVLSEFSGVGESLSIALSNKNFSSVQGYLGEMMAIVILHSFNVDTNRVKVNTYGLKQKITTIGGAKNQEHPVDSMFTIDGQKVGFQIKNVNDNIYDWSGKMSPSAFIGGRLQEDSSDKISAIRNYIGLATYHNYAAPGKDEQTTNILGDKEYQNFYLSLFNKENFLGLFKKYFDSRILDIIRFEFYDDNLKTWDAIPFYIFDGHLISGSEMISALIKTKQSMGNASYFSSTYNFYPGKTHWKKSDDPNSSKNYLPIDSYGAYADEGQISYSIKCYFMKLYSSLMSGNF